MKIIFTVEDAFGEEFDTKFVDAKNYSSRAEAVKHLMRTALEEQSNASFHEHTTTGEG